MVKIADLDESHRQMGNRISELERLLTTQGEINGKLLSYLTNIIQQVGDIEEDNAKAKGLILPPRLSN